MEATSKYNFGHVFLAAVGGALAGAAAALLLAPKSGVATRRQLNGYLETAKEEVSRIPEHIRSAGAAAKEKMSQELAAFRHE